MFPRVNPFSYVGNLDARRSLQTGAGAVRFCVACGVGIFTRRRAADDRRVTSRICRAAAAGDGDRHDPVIGDFSTGLAAPLRLRCAGARCNGLRMRNNFA
jgi:hypothetical protein